MKVVTVELSPSVRRGEKLLVVGGRRRLSNSLSGLFPALKRAHPPRANGKVEQQVGVLHPPPSLPPSLPSVGASRRSKWTHYPLRGKESRTSPVVCLIVWAGLSAQWRSFNALALTVQLCLKDLRDSL